jgi:ATP-binding protein involved in chromosome partitioning
MTVKKRIEAQYILAIGAGKGGVGKSTLSSILAQVFNKNGLKVGVLDADLYGPSMRIMLGSGSKEVSIQQGLIQPADCQGIKVVGLSYFQMDNVNITRAPVANGLIERMLFEVNWGSLDILLIDLPPGTGDIPLTIMQKAPISAALLVSTPQLVALSDVHKFMTLCKASRIPILGLVENMAYFEDSVTRQVFYPFGEGKSYAFCKQCEIELLAQIGIDPKLTDALDCAKNLLDSVSCSTREGFERLGDKVYTGVQKQNRLSFSIEKLHKRACLLNILKRKVVLNADAIQKRCPCANCSEGAKVMAPEVLGVEKLGLGAVKFAFSSGCSSGIYPVELLCMIGGIE